MDLLGRPLLNLKKARKKEEGKEVKKEGRKEGRKETSTARVHQMQLLCRHSFIIVVVVIVVVGHLKSFQPKKPTDGRMDRWKDQRTDTTSYRDA